MMNELVRRVYTIAWDGAPKPGGGCHVQTEGELHSLGEAVTLLEVYKLKALKTRSRKAKKNLRIRTRLATDWKDVC